MPLITHENGNNEFSIAGAAPNATLNSAYSHQVAATSANGHAMVYALASGTLPPGVTLDSATGLLSGTPNTAGTYNFNIKVDPADTNAGEIYAGSVLIFEDQFAGTAFDPAKWDHRAAGQARREGWNHEAAIEVGGGHLKIKFTHGGDGKQYAGSVSTNDLHEFKYGYFEARMKPFDAYGTLSSFWLQSKDYSSGLPVAQAGAEIDIAQALKKYNGNANHAVHWGGYGAGHQQTQGFSSGQSLYDGNFHVFGLKWEPGKYTMYIDGVEVFTTTDGASDRAEYIVLTGEVANVWGKGPNNEIFDTEPEGEIQWDYVRVYQPASANRDFTIQVAAGNSAPTITGNPPDGQVGAAYDFDFTTADADGDTVSLSVKAGSALPPGLSLTGNKLAGTPTTAGSTSFVLVADDGNGGSVEHAVTMNVAAAANNAPTLSGTPTSGTVGHAYSFTPNAADADGDTLSFSSTALPTGLSLNGSTGEISGTPTATGTTLVTITVNDGNGGSATHSIDIVINAVPNTAPTISGTPTSGTVGQAYSFTPTSADADGDTLSFSSTALPTGLSLNASTGEISGTPTATGSTPVTITVSDGNGGSATHQVDIVINAVPNTAPTISGTPPDGQVGVAYTFDFTTADADGDTVSLSIAGGLLPDGLSLSGNTLSGTPTADGSFTFSLEANDGRGGVTSSGQIVVNIAAAANNAPTVSGTPPAAQAGAAFDFDFTTADADGDTVSLSVKAGSTLPAGLSLTGNKLSGTPTTVGSYPFTLVAEDGNGGSAEHSVTLVVAAAPNVAPTLTGAPPEAQVGSAYDFGFITQDADGDTVTLSLKAGSVLPPGLALVGNDVTGTPTMAGSYNFALVAADGNGGETELAVTLVVKPKPVPPEINMKLTSVFLFRPYCRGGKLIKGSPHKPALACLPNAEAHRLVEQGVADLAHVDCGKLRPGEHGGTTTIPGGVNGMSLGSEILNLQPGVISILKDIPAEANHAEFSVEVAGKPTSVRFTSAVNSVPDPATGAGHLTFQFGELESRDEITNFKVMPDLNEAVILYIEYFKKG